MMSRLISVVGDSNVRRNMTSLNMSSRETIKSSEVIDCSNIASLDSALRSVRKESNLCIVACITDFLVVAGECGTILSAIDPVLASFSQKLTSFCASRQSLQVRFMFVVKTWTFSVVELLYLCLFTIMDMTL